MVEGAVEDYEGNNDGTAKDVQILAVEPTRTALFCRSVGDNPVHTFTIMKASSQCEDVEYIHHHQKVDIRNYDDRENCYKSEIGIDSVEHVEIDFD